MSQTPQHMSSSAEPYYVASAGDFFQLMKPRVMSLVVFTGFAGMYLAPATQETSLSVILLGAISLFAIAAGAGASGAINQWYDRDIDAVMTRTMGRPIPSGRVQSEEALALGLVISVLSVLLLSLSANLLAGGLLAFTIFFYAVIYSIWLKRRTPQNIVIGGAALNQFCFLRLSLFGHRLIFGRWLWSKMMIIKLLMCRCCLLLPVWMRPKHKS